MNSWNTVGVVGAGTMGSGIAQVAAQAGCQVWLCDQNPEVLHQSERSLQGILARLVDKGKMTSDEASEVAGRIVRTTTLDQLSTCDVIVEAIVEDLSVKSQVFQTLEGLVSEACILATNTSSLSVTALASACKLPNRVIGLHFFNPAPLMALVEVVPALQSEPGLVDVACEQMTAWGKSPAVAKDTPGFIVNRVARPFYSEALRIFDEGVASPADIDASMRAQGFRMGPFELMDLIGHDVNYTVTSTVHAAFFGDSRYRPSHTQRQLVAAQWLGRKTGRGFFEYPKDQPHTGAQGSAVDGVAERILAMLMNEAFDAVFWQVASPEHIDLAMQKGVNYPQGLIAWAEAWGLKRVVTVLDGLRQKFGEERYRCSPLLRERASTGERFFSP